MEIKKFKEVLAEIADLSSGFQFTAVTISISSRLATVDVNCNFLFRSAVFGPHCFLLKQVLVGSVLNESLVLWFKKTKVNKKKKPFVSTVCASAES